jgi:hypothetical protein
MSPDDGLNYWLSFAPDDSSFAAQANIQASSPSATISRVAGVRVLAADPRGRSSIDAGRPLDGAR